MNPEEAPDCWTYVSDWEAAGLLVILLFLLHILVRYPLRFPSRTNSSFPIN